MRPGDSDITCPDSTVLERCAAGDATDEALAVHIATCERCRSEMARIRADNALIAEILQAKDTVDEGSAPVIASYTILEEIYRGGQGVVHRALHKPTNRVVALKTLLSGRYATSRQRLRFDREVELAARLRHPGIVSIYDSGVDSKNQCYIAMEYVEGETLAERYPRGAGFHSPNVDDVLNLFARIADAVAFAHSRGVIHRDLKPSNVIVDGAGEPRIVDFGIAKPAEYDDPTKPDVTVTGEFVGTLRYAAPEQLAADPENADVRADVYALGVMLYEALTGKSPHEPSLSVAETLQRVISKDPARPSALRKDIDQDTDTILLTSLALDPTRRYQSASALRDDIRARLDGRAINARRDDAWYVTRKWIDRHRAPVAAAGVFVVLLLAFGVTMTLLYNRATRAETDAKEAARKAWATLGTIAGPVSRIDTELAADRVTESELLDTVADAVNENLRAYPDMASGLHASLGFAYLDAEQFDKALEHLRAALDAERRIARGDSVGLGEAHHNLGRALWRTGDFAQAEEHYRESLRIRLSLLGESNLDTARTMQHLSVTIQNTGQIEEAAELIARAIEIRTELLPKDHPDIANAMTALGGLLQEAGRYEESIEPLSEARRIAVDTFGESDWRVARVGHNLGVSLMHLDRYDEAEALFASALVAKRQWWTDVHSDVSSSLIELARLRLDAHHDVEGALAAATEALAIHESVLTGPHPQQVNLQLVLADLSDAPDAALAHLDSALLISLEVYGENHWRTAGVLREIGEHHLRTGAPHEAQAPLDRSVAVLRIITPARNDELHASLYALAECYDALGETATASELRREADALQASAQTVSN